MADLNFPGTPTFGDVVNANNPNTFSPPLQAPNTYNNAGPNTGGNAGGLVTSLSHGRRQSLIMKAAASPDPLILASAYTPQTPSKPNQPNTYVQIPSPEPNFQISVQSSTALNPYAAQQQNAKTPNPYDANPPIPYAVHQQTGNPPNAPPTSANPPNPYAAQQQNTTPANPYNQQQSAYVHQQAGNPTNPYDQPPNLNPGQQQRGTGQQQEGPYTQQTQQPNQQSGAQQANPYTQQQTVPSPAQPSSVYGSSAATNPYSQPSPDADPYKHQCAVSSAQQSVTAQPTNPYNAGQNTQQNPGNLLNLYAAHQTPANPYNQNTTIPNSQQNAQSNPYGQQTNNATEGTVRQPQSQQQAANPYQQPSNQHQQRQPINPYHQASNEQQQQQPVNPYQQPLNQQQQQQPVNPYQQASTKQPQQQPFNPYQQASNQQQQQQPVNPYQQVPNEQQQQQVSNPYQQLPKQPQQQQPVNQYQAASNQQSPQQSVNPYQQAQNQQQQQPPVNSYQHPSNRQPQQQPIDPYQQASNQQEQQQPTNPYQQPSIQQEQQQPVNPYQQASNQQRQQQPIEPYQQASNQQQEQLGGPYQQTPNQLQQPPTNPYQQPVSPYQQASNHQQQVNPYQQASNDASQQRFTNQIVTQQQSQSQPIDVQQQPDNTQQPQAANPQQSAQQPIEPSQESTPSAQKGHDPRGTLIVNDAHRTAIASLTDGPTTRQPDEIDSKSQFNIPNDLPTTKKELEEGLDSQQKSGLSAGEHSNSKESDANGNDKSDKPKTSVRTSMKKYQERDMLAHISRTPSGEASSEIEDVIATAKPTNYSLEVCPSRLVMPLDNQKQGEIEAIIVKKASVDIDDDEEFAIHRSLSVATGTMSKLTSRAGSKQSDRSQAVSIPSVGSTDSERGRIVHIDSKTSAVSDDGTSSFSIEKMRADMKADKTKSDAISEGDSAESDANAGIAKDGPIVDVEKESSEKPSPEEKEILAEMEKEHEDANRQARRLSLEAMVNVSAIQQVERKSQGQVEQKSKEEAMSQKQNIPTVKRTSLTPPSPAGDRPASVFQRGATKHQKPQPAEEAARKEAPPSGRNAFQRGATKHQKPQPAEEAARKESLPSGGDPFQRGATKHQKPQPAEEAARKEAPPSGKNAFQRGATKHQKPQPAEEAARKESPPPGKNATEKNDTSGKKPDTEEKKGTTEDIVSSYVQRTVSGALIAEAQKSEPKPRESAAEESPAGEDSSTDPAYSGRLASERSMVFQSAVSSAKSTESAEGEAVFQSAISSASEEEGGAFANASNRPGDSSRLAEETNAKGPFRDVSGSSLPALTGTTEESRMYDSEIDGSKSTATEVVVTKQAIKSSDIIADPSAASTVVEAVLRQQQVALKKKGATDDAGTKVGSAADGNAGDDDVMEHLLAARMGYHQRDSICDEHGLLHYDDAASHISSNQRESIGVSIIKNAKGEVIFDASKHVIVDKDSKEAAKSITATSKPTLAPLDEDTILVERQISKGRQRTKEEDEMKQKREEEEARLAQLKREREEAEQKLEELRLKNDEEEKVRRERKVQEEVERQHEEALRIAQAEKVEEERKKAMEAHSRKLINEIREANRKPDASAAVFMVEKEKDRKRVYPHQVKLEYPKVKARKSRASHDHPFLSRKEKLWVAPQMYAKPGEGWHQVLARERPPSTITATDKKSSMDDIVQTFQGKCNFKSTLSHRYLIPFGYENIHGTLKRPRKLLWELEPYPSIFPLKLNEKSYRIRCVYPRGIDIDVEKAARPSCIAGIKFDPATGRPLDVVEQDVEMDAVEQLNLKNSNLESFIKEKAEEKFDFSVGNIDILKGTDTKDKTGKQENMLIPKLFLYTEGSVVRISTRSSVFIFERFEPNEKGHATFRLGFEHMYLKEESGIYSLTTNENLGTRFTLETEADDEIPLSVPSSRTAPTTNQARAIQHRLRQVRQAGYHINEEERTNAVNTWKLKVLELDAELQREKVMCRKAEKREAYLLHELEILYKATKS